MNFYQQHNTELQNEPYMVEHIKDAKETGNLVNIAQNSSLFKCVHCGRTNITSRIMDFMRFNPARYMCYECQKQNKEPVTLGDEYNLDNHDCHGGPESGCKICTERFWNDKKAISGYEMTEEYDIITNR